MYDSTHNSPQIEVKGLGDLPHHDDSKNVLPASVVANSPAEGDGTGPREGPAPNGTDPFDVQTVDAAGRVSPSCSGHLPSQIPASRPCGR